MVTYLGSLVQSCRGEGGTLQTNITGVCGGSACSFVATVDLPLITVYVLSQSTPLRLQVAVQGNCLKRALGCMHFPGLSRSGSGFQVLHKGVDLVGPSFCALPWSEQLRLLGAWQVHSPRWAMHLSHLPGPSHSVLQVRHESTVSGVLCLLWGADLRLRHSRQISTTQDSRKT